MKSRANITRKDVASDTLGKPESSQQQWFRLGDKLVKQYFR